MYAKDLLFAVLFSLTDYAIKVYFIKAWKGGYSTGTNDQPWTHLPAAGEIHHESNHELVPFQTVIFQFSKSLLLPKFKLSLALMLDCN